jgi:hypothetical protein
MPRLVLFTACEKTIFDMNGPVSLISIFQRMNIPLQSAPLPEKAVVPTLWSIFSLWETEPKERGQEFKQTVRVYAPDGVLFMEQEGMWKNDSSEDSQIKIGLQVAGLPIWTEGFIQVRVWLDNEETEAGSYRFRIHYLPKEENAKPAEDPAS